MNLSQLDRAHRQGSVVTVQDFLTSASLPLVFFWASIYDTPVCLYELKGSSQVSTKLRVILINEGLPVNAMCWYLFCQVVEDQQRRHTFHTESSGDLPDLNLLRISMECSEPRRVIMLTIQVQCLRVAKWSHSICGVHIDPPGQLWMKMKCSSLLHQVL